MNSSLVDMFYLPDGLYGLHGASLAYSAKSVFYEDAATAPLVAFGTS